MTDLLLAHERKYGADVEMGACRGNPVLNIVHLDFECLLEVGQRHLRLVCSEEPPKLLPIVATEIV